MKIKYLFNIKIEEQNNEILLLREKIKSSIQYSSSPIKKTKIDDNSNVKPEKFELEPEMEIQQLNEICRIYFIYLWNLNKISEEKDLEIITLKSKIISLTNVRDMEKKEKEMDTDIPLNKQSTQTIDGN